MTRRGWLWAALPLVGCVLPPLELENAPCDSTDLCSAPYTCVLEVNADGGAGAGSCHRDPCGPWVGKPCQLQPGTCGAWSCNAVPGGLVLANSNLIACAASTTAFHDCCCDPSACPAPAFQIQNQVQPSAIGASGSGVFWTSFQSGEVLHVTPGSTNPEPVCSGLPFPARMWLSPDHLFYVTQPPRLPDGGAGYLDGGLFECPLEGGVMAQPVQRGNSFIDVTGDGGDLFWLAENHVQTLGPLNTPTVLPGLPQQFLYATGLATTATTLYLSQRSGAGNPGVEGFQLPGQGPALGTLPLVFQVEDEDVRGLALDAVSVYWAHTLDGGSHRIARQRQDQDGGVEAVGYGMGEPHAVVLTAGGVYWTTTADGGGAWLMGAPLDGGAGACLANGGYVDRLAQDGLNVYWTDLAAGTVNGLPLQW